MEYEDDMYQVLKNDRKFRRSINHQHTDTKGEMKRKKMKKNLLSICLVHCLVPCSLKEAHHSRATSIMQTIMTKLAIV